MWSQSQLSDAQTQTNFKTPLLTAQGPFLQQNDFLKIINLQQRYNYYKSLIKLQRLHNFNEETNQSSLIKIMHQLIQYYAECISQAEMHKENIIMYFQQKMKDLNYHYKAIQDKQKNDKIKQTEIEMKKNISELGNIKQSMSIFGLQQQLQNKNPQLQSINMKNNHNKTLMAAIQNQNIQQHINNTMKKVDFLKKSIASIIQNQEQKLQNRIKDKRRKIPNYRIKPNTPQSITTEATSNQKLEIPFKKKKQTYSSFHTSYHARLTSSDSELDEAESFYISTFNIEDQQKSSRKA